MRNQWSSPWGGYLLGFLVCALLPTPLAHGADAPQRLEPSLSKNTRLMVFSPHPDDESLAAAGLIQRVLSLGGSVKVVFMTSGDGPAVKQPRGSSLGTTPDPPSRASDRTVTPEVAGSSPVAPKPV